MFEYDTVFQFKIILEDVKPSIWRRIQAPSNYNFYSLHVAIVNAIQYEDLDVFWFKGMDKTGKSLLITDDELPWMTQDLMMNSEACISNFFTRTENVMSYTSSGWEHSIEFEGEYERMVGKSYPVCLAGENAAPPEHVIDSEDYVEFLEIIRNPKHKDYANHLKENFCDFDPTFFDLKTVIFESPEAQLDYEKDHEI